MKYDIKDNILKRALCDPPVGIFLAALIAAGGALLGVSWLVFISAIASAIGALWASRQRADFERHLREKSDEIAKLNKEIMDLVIGGDSYCYMVISNIDQTTNVGLLVFVHQGDDPLYGVTARVVDLQKFEEIEGHPPLEAIMQAQKLIFLGDMAVGIATMTGPIELGTGMKKDYNIFFSARNGLFNQELHLRKIRGRWLQKTEVTRSKHLLYERTDPNYPSDDDIH